MFIFSLDHGTSCVLWEHAELLRWWLRVKPRYINTTEGWDWEWGWGRQLQSRKHNSFKTKNKTKQNKCLLKAQMDKPLTSSFGLCNKSLQRIRWDFKGIKIFKTRQLMNLKRAFAWTGKWYLKHPFLPYINTKGWVRHTGWESGTFQTSKRLGKQSRQKALQNPRLLDLDAFESVVRALKLPTQKSTPVSKMGH